MAWMRTDLWPVWGSMGVRPAANFDYQGAQQIEEGEINHLWHSLYQVENDIDDALTQIDSNGDGVVDEADSALRYKNNDLDPNADGVVGAAENVTETYKGTDLDEDYANVGETPTVDSGSFHVVYVDTLADSEVVTFHQLSFLRADGTNVPSGVSLRVYSLDGGVSDETEITGTTQVDTTSGFSYTNNSGGQQTIAMVVDNGNFDGGAGTTVDVHTSFTVRIT